MDLERLGKELLEALRKAKLGDDPFYKELAKMIEETEVTRRSRFDAADNGYKGF